MSQPIHIRMGGYGPPTTAHSRALKMIGYLGQAAARGGGARFGSEMFDLLP